MAAITISPPTIERTRAATRTEAAPVEVPDRPNYRSIYASSIFAVSMLFLFGVAVPAAMVYGSATGWGLGAFCAIWGGPSFGVMVGGARVSAWYEKHDVPY